MEKFPPVPPEMESDDPQRRLTARTRNSKHGKRAMIIHGPVKQTFVKIDRSAFSKSSILVLECETLATVLLQMQAETLVCLSIGKALAQVLVLRMGKCNCLRLFLFPLIRTMMIVGPL